MSLNRSLAGLCRAVSACSLLVLWCAAPRDATAQPFTNGVIFEENQKPGTANWLLTNPAVNGEIEGYASATSVNRGEQIDLLVNTTNAAWSLEVYRVGWYSGVGARRVFGPVMVPGTVQAIPAMDAVTGLVECAWINPYTLYIPDTPDDPTDWASGVYLAKLTGSQDGRQSYIIFAVRDDNHPADLLAQMSFTTYQAYNTWGGASLYTSTNPSFPRAAKVSFNRPYVTPVGSSVIWKGAGEFFGRSPGTGWECNLVRWLEREGYEVAYCSDLDVHSSTNLLWNHKAFLSMGHDEYWSYPMRWNVQGARDRGVNLGFLASNIAYWQARLEPGADGTPDRTLVCYKSTSDPVFNTPSNYLTTVSFRSYPVQDPESSMLGVLYNVSGPTGDLILCDSNHWTLTNTGLPVGYVLPGLLGYEVDSTNSLSPAGIRAVTASPYMTGDMRDPTLSYSHAASYIAASGATVFASGSMQWSWGLDDLNTPTQRESVQNPAAQQMTRNILARLINIPAPTATLLFRTDTSTAGSWKPHYGSDGLVLPNESTNLPAYVSLSSSGGSVATYLANSGDTRCLARISTASRYLAGWSSPTNFILDVNLTDHQNHLVAFYCWDWDNSDRTQIIEVLDATTTNLLDRRIINNFTNGQWWVWQVGGHVKFRFTNLGGPDCLASAIVFGGGAAATFVGEDPLTQGNWKPYYGADGQCLAGDGFRFPSYASLIPSGALTNWSGAAMDARSCESYGATNRLLSAWCGGNVTTYYINSTDNAWHQLAIYCVDADQVGRRQFVSLVDQSSNAVLDRRELTNFSGGKYLVWNVRGAVKIRVQRSGPISTAVNGIFLGPPNQPPTVTLASPSNLQVFNLPTNIVLTANAADADGTVSQVSFFADGLLLGVATNAPFSITWSNALVGQYDLSAVALDNRHATTTSASYSIFVQPPLNYQPPIARVTQPADGSAWQAPTNLTFSATVTATSAPIATLQFLADGVPFGPVLSNAPYVMVGRSPYPGTHSIRVTVTDKFGVEVTSPGNLISILAPASSATFRETDSNTQGTWKSMYGSEGYSIMNFATNLPPYATLTPTGSTPLNYASSTTDPRGLQRPGGTDRVAGMWYSYANWVLDVNLVDGSTHRLALYCVDWLRHGGAETVQVLDATSGQTLDTRVLNTFANGAYLIWDVAGHVQFRFTRADTQPAGLFGIFFDPPRSRPVVATLTPASGASFAAPTNILITARAYAGNTNLSRVEFYANGTLVGVDTVGPDFSCTWTNPPPGLYALSTRAVQGDDANALSSPALVTVEAASAAAIWVPSNTTRQGGWLGDLGRQGYLVAGDSTNAPSYANASVGSQVITWAGFTTDSRALQRDSGNGRLAAAWYDYTNVVLDVQCTDALFHRLNVYCLDWYSQGRTQTVDVIDNVSGIVLDHRQHEPFYGGTWLTWEIRGHVRLRFQCAGNLPAVVSGVFFDPSASMPTITITNPIAGAIFTSPTNLSIAADAVADANNVTRVDFYDGTILLGSVTNGPPYVFQWNNPPLGGRFVLAREVGPAGTVDSVAVRLNVVATNSVCFLNTTYLPDGTAQFDVCGPPGTTMRLDASFVLGPNAAWTPVQTNSSGAGRFSFLVTDPLIYPQRFYRIVPLP